VEFTKRGDGRFDESSTRLLHPVSACKVDAERPDPDDRAGRVVPMTRIEPSELLN
jgi:hypothetical protein